jgi:hypothetical protein
MAGIYNEHFLPFVCNYIVCTPFSTKLIASRRLVNGKHPGCLGRPHHETWKELYERPSVDQSFHETWGKGRSRGEGTLLLNQLYFLLINGQLQERFFNLKLLPVISNSGETIAFYETLTEITNEILYERRERCIRRFCDLEVPKSNEFYLKIAELLDEMGTLWTSLCKDQPLTLISRGHSFCYCLVSGTTLRKKSTRCSSFK